MAIPFSKAFITASRIFLRPINNLVIRKFKSMGKESRGYIYFVRFGQMSNRFEVKMNRLLLGSSGLTKIPELAESLAFEKGVEWFTEVVFFYGLLCAMAWYELDRQERSRIA